MNIHHNLDSSDMAKPHIRLVQHISEDKEFAGKLCLTKVQGNVYNDSFDICVIRITKAYFVWNKEFQSIAVIPAHNTDMVNDMLVPLGRSKGYAYRDDETADVQFTYVYDIVVIDGTTLLPAMVYMKKSNLGCAQKMNAYISYLPADTLACFTLRSVEKKANKKSWFQYDHAVRSGDAISEHEKQLIPRMMQSLYAIEQQGGEETYL